MNGDGEFDPHDVRLMQGLAQRVTALRPELVNNVATVGELAWVWGMSHHNDRDTWRRRLWYDRAEMVGWGWQLSSTPTWSGRYTLTIRGPSTRSSTGMTDKRHGSIAARRSEPWTMTPSIAWPHTATCRRKGRGRRRVLASAQPA
jgi:hypothetical protein